MKPAVVDIGSNTVKMKIYEISSGKLAEVYSSVNNAKLISYIENGILSFDGISVLCGIISNFKEQSKAQNADSFTCFATASLRRTSNISEIRDTVLSVCGESIDLVSGDEEAFYSFSGVKHTTPDFPRNALLIDMGGGSTEVVKCKNAEREASESMGFGSLSLWLDLGEKGFDTMKSYASDTFKKTAVYPIKTKNAVLVGGTALAINKLYGVFYPDAEPYIMSFDALSKMYDSLCIYDKNVIALLEKHVPHRVTTVIPGLAAYLGIFEAAGVNTVKVSTCGIREGYVYEKLLRNSEV